MILVPNPLQLLSGSRFTRLFILSFLISYNSYANLTKSKCFSLDKGLSSNILTIENKTENQDSLYEITFRGKKFLVPPHKKSFKIAVLLPFHTDAVNSPIDKKRANVMLEYYQGIKTAIKQIDSLDSKFIISFYDTDNDTNQLKKILASSEMKSVDIIIGPTNRNQVQIASSYCKSNKIPLLLPITNWIDSDFNPYVFNLNPSEVKKAEVFLTYYKNHHKDKKLVIIRDNGYYDRTFGNALINTCKQQQTSVKIVPYSTKIDWSSIIDGNSIVIHTTQDKIKLNYTVTSLQAHHKNVILVGSDKLLEFNDIDYNQWEKLNILFLSEHKSQVPNMRSNQMKVAYRLDYRDDPSWFSYMGYDHVLFACEVLDAFGTYFPLFIEGKEITYANMDFSMNRTESNFQNKYLGIFRLVDGQLMVENIK